jgi:hypothetical protein
MVFVRKLGSHEMPNRPTITRAEAEARVATTLKVVWALAGGILGWKAASAMLDLLQFV